jgi:hypothetical protein
MRISPHKTRASDHMNRTLNIVVLGLSALSPSFCQTAGPLSFWTSATLPSTLQVGNDTASVTLGLKFYSDVSGSVTGVRFYKGPNNSGPHIGDLWSATGTKLAEVTFSTETASGWQQANFSSPVSIVANAAYVVSYLAPKGSYGDTQAYDWTTLHSTPLHVSGSSPGVYAYGSGPIFPAGTWNSSNYAVDLVFVPSTAQVSPLPPTTGAAFWNNSTLPATPCANDTASVTLGLKFYSDVAGSVTAVRFYKGPNNTGTHVGDLWSDTGTKLAEITFSAETASGWQQANFSPPVNIAANATYVVSYLAPKGYYAYSPSYSWATLNSAPLHVSGSSPGVYTYGSGPMFPGSTYNGTNYYVDLVFNPSGTTVIPPTTYIISGHVSGSAAKVTLSGASSGSTTTDSAGNYSFSGLTSGSYVVAPSQSGYVFSPSTASVSINSASIQSVNFTATLSPIVPPVSQPITHTVVLTWVSSTSTNIQGYNLYRSTASGSGYSKLNASPLPSTSYIDSSVTSGQTYFYVATTVDNTDSESAYSSQSTAAVPTP